MQPENGSTAPLEPNDDQSKLLKAYAALEPDQQAWLVKYLDAGDMEALEKLVDSEPKDYNNYNPITRRVEGADNNHYRSCAWAVYGMLCVGGVLAPADFDFTTEAEEKATYAERLDGVIEYIYHALRCVFDDSYGGAK